MALPHIWTFSPSSEPYLQRCIAAALLQENDNNNKWIQIFGRKLDNTSPTPDAEVKPAAEIIDTTPSPEQMDKNYEQATYANFLPNIENGIINLDFIIEECSRKPDLMLIMAQQLSVHTVEKLFNQLLTRSDINTNFLSGFLYTFLPTYIKVLYSWLCIDLIVKTNDKYPEMFQKLLEILLEDIQIPNNVLSNYVSMLCEEKRSNFMENLTNIELTSESFLHNILAINTVYKDCKKTERIQKYIEKNLLQHSIICASDINYGKLFLAYLQAEKSLECKVNVKQLEECLEMHRSPFKRPCIKILKEFYEVE